jgi:hypothetical protein
MWAAIRCLCRVRDTHSNDTTGASPIQPDSRPFTPFGRGFVTMGHGLDVKDNPACGRGLTGVVIRVETLLHTIDGKCYPREARPRCGSVSAWSFVPMLPDESVRPSQSHSVVASDRRWSALPLNEGVWPRWSLRIAACGLKTGWRGCVGLALWTRSQRVASGGGWGAGLNRSKRGWFWRVPRSARSSPIQRSRG